jgi:hypothetical protein
MVLNLEGNLGIQLILGQPFLRDVEKRIDVGPGEIRFLIGVDNIFFKFQYMKEQCFVIHQGRDGSGIWGGPLPEPGTPPTTQA